MAQRRAPTVGDGHLDIERAAEVFGAPRGLRHEPEGDVGVLRDGGGGAATMPIATSAAATAPRKRLTAGIVAAGCGAPMQVLSG